MHEIKTLTVKQVAQELEVSPGWVRNKIHAGEIRASNVGTAERPQYRIRKAVLDAFLKDRTVVGIEEG